MKIEINAAGLGGLVWNLDGVCERETACRAERSDGTGMVYFLKLDGWGNKMIK